jgi:pilus assembly protein FimV
MNLRKIALQLFIMLNFVTAIHAADFQQVQLKGPKNATDQFSGTVYGPIESSDTLWQISQRYRQNNALSIYQVMQAIYELNPDAFEQQNINLLRDGSMLKLPSERYIARVSSQQAKQKAERDSQKLQANNGTTPAVSSSISPNSQQQSAANTAKLDQTKEFIEQKLGAIDEAQTRQFKAIRKQFAESISSVQSILDGNKKLFERLDKVNADIDEMRGQEQQKSLQMNQMGESIEELLEKSRQDDAVKAAQMAEQDTSLLDNPLTLILAFTLPVLLVLAAFAYWMIKRKSLAVVKPVEDDIDDLSLDPLAAEMDDLSDALSAELSGDSGDELDDDNLFGDDDLLDDVLAEELEESLDDALEDSIEEPLVDDSEMFDELGDDDLDDVLEEEFEAGAEVVEQDDLDSLFDEDDDLLADIDEELSTDSSEGIEDDLLAEVQDGDDNSDLENMLIEEDEQQVDAQVDDMEYEEDEPLLTPVAADEEQPEISIDELLDESAEQNVENPLLDDSDDINEEVLQNLDKEIVSQNEELDSVTGSLIDELEQVELIRSMMPEDDEELSDVEEPQLDIQKLDDLAEEIDDELLGDDFDEEDTIEIDISEVLNDTIQPTEMEEQLKPELQGEAEPLAESVQVEEIEALDAPEQAEEIEVPVAPEQANEAEALVAPEQADEAEELVASEQAEETEKPIAPEQADEAEEPVAPEQADEAEALVAPEQADEAEEPVAPEQADEAEALVAPEQADEIEEPVALEQANEAEALVAPEQADEIEEPVAPEQTNEAEALVAPEQANEAEELVASEQTEETEKPIAPEQADEAEEPVAPEQADEAEALVAPEQADEIEEPVAPEQANEAEALDALEQADEIEEPVAPEQTNEAEALVAPEQADDVEELLEAELDKPTSGDSTLDEDQLEKALEDFEKEELDEVLEDLTSNESASISSLDDLEFSADDFVTKDQTAAAVSNQQPTLDDIDSIEDFDDSELDSAFDESIDGSSFESSQSNRDELDDLPGLGDWLGDDAVKPNEQQSAASEDKDLIDELEGSSFDEMLESIDLDDDLSIDAEDDTGFDIAALLDESPQSEENDVNEQDTEDFLDVEALLNESVGAESDDEIDKALDLDIPLEPFVNEFDNLEMIDVDADDGLGAKLDLAHAYIEIGEEESAKELLDEILQKGSTEQVAAAKKVLDNLD